MARRVGLVLLSLVLAAGSLLSPAPGPAQAASSTRLAVAAYYPWWGTPTGPTGYWSQWYDDSGHLLIKDHPYQLYDTASPRVISAHLAAAAASGLNGLAASWWGRGTIEDHDFGVMLSTAASTASPVHLALHFETGGMSAGGPSEVTAQLAYALGQYASQPSYLHYLGRPVVFIYNPAALTTDYSVWSSIIHSSAVSPFNAFFIVDSFGADAASVFDGIYQFEPFGPNLPYDPSALYSKYAAARSLASSLGKLFVASVEPGFDDSAVRPQTMYVPRNGTSTYDQTWNIALANHPDWVFVATWNEWHEASEIEWSTEYGRTFLDDTARWSTTFQSLP